MGRENPLSPRIAAARSVSARHPSQVVPRVGERRERGTERAHLIAGEAAREAVAGDVERHACRGRRRVPILPRIDGPVTQVVLDDELAHVAVGLESPDEPGDRRPRERHAARERGHVERRACRSELAQHIQALHRQLEWSELRVGGAYEARQRGPQREDEVRRMPRHFGSQPRVVVGGIEASSEEPPALQCHEVVLGVLSLPRHAPSKSHVTLFGRRRRQMRESLLLLGRAGRGLRRRCFGHRTSLGRPLGGPRRCFGHRSIPALRSRT